MVNTFAVGEAFSLYEEVYTKDRATRRSGKNTRWYAEMVNIAT